MKTRIAASAFALLAMAPLGLLGSAPASAATLDRIKETGHIRLGFRADAQPISYRDSGGKAAGYAVDLCLRVVEAIKGELALPNLTVDWVPVTAESRWTAVQAGEVDLVCGPDTATLARRKEVTFSIPIFPGGIGALVRTDAPERVTTILSGKTPQFQPTWRANAGQVLLAQRFAVVRGTTAENWVAGKTAELELNFQVTPVDSYDAGVKRLIDGDADVFFGDRALLLEATGRSGSGRHLALLARNFTYEPLALVMARGDEDFRLIVDRALSWLYNNGKAAELYTNCCGKPDEGVLAFYRMTALPE
jgi:ABC-type amino acid transport substrate-binding protein